MGIYASKALISGPTSENIICFLIALLLSGCEQNYFPVRGLIMDKSASIQEDLDKLEKIMVNNNFESYRHYLANNEYYFGRLSSDLAIYSNKNNHKLVMVVARDINFGDIVLRLEDSSQSGSKFFGKSCDVYLKILSDLKLEFDGRLLKWSSMTDRC